METKPTVATTKETLSSDQLEIALLNDISKKLSKLLGITGKLLAESLNEADSGEYLVLEKTATTDVEIYYMKDLTGHYVKGYSLENTGTTEISVGHNADKSQRYTSIPAGGITSFSFNRKNIRSIYIKTDSGTSTYKLTISW